MVNAQLQRMCDNQRCKRSCSDCEKRHVTTHTPRGIVSYRFVNLVMLASSERPGYRSTEREVHHSDANILGAGAGKRMVETRRGRWLRRKAIQITEPSHSNEGADEMFRNVTAHTSWCGFHTPSGVAPRPWEQTTLPSL